MQETPEMWIWFLGREDPLEKGKWQLTPEFLPGKFHGQRSLAGSSPWGHKEWDVTERSYRLDVHSLQWWDILSIGLHGPFRAWGFLWLPDYIWGAKIFYKFANSPACLFMPPFFPSVFAYTQVQCLESRLGSSSAFRGNSCPPPPPVSWELKSYFLFWGRNRESFLVCSPHSSFCCQELLSLWSPLQLWELWISSLLHLVTRLSKDCE